MTLKEYQAKYGRKYLEEDKALEPAFEALSSRMKSKDLGWFFYDGTKLRPTLRRYGDLTEQERIELHSGIRTPSRGKYLMEAGLILRTFGKPRSDIYDELKARLKFQYRKTLDTREREWDEISIMDSLVNRHNELIRSGVEFGKFARKYAKLGEAQKKPVLNILADLHTLAYDPEKLVHVGNNWHSAGEVRFWNILDSVRNNMPNNLDHLASDEGLTEVRFNEAERFLYLNRDRIIGMHDRIDKQDIFEWEDLFRWADLSNVPAFIDLSEADLQLVYQAYHFAKESNRHTDQKGVEHAEVPRQFISGFRSSLRQGTVKSWARAIVGHFRTDSTGGGNYRVLAGGAA